MRYKYPQTGDNFTSLTFLFEIFPLEVSPGSPTPIVISLCYYTVLDSAFLDTEALYLPLKCTFQYTLPVLAAMVSEPSVNHR